MKKVYKVFITKSAQQDLSLIYSFIAADSPDEAKRFLIQLEQKISSLASLPERAAFIPENAFFGTEYRHLIHDRYRVSYRIDAKEVFVLRIIHEAKLLEL